MTYDVHNLDATFGGTVATNVDYDHALAAAIHDSLDVADPVVISRAENLETVAIIEHGKVTFDCRRSVF